MSNHDLERPGNQNASVLLKKKMFRFAFALIAFSFCRTLEARQSAYPPSLQVRIDSALRMDLSEGSPGLAMGIVESGKIRYEKYAGLANLADSLPIDVNTRFNIASNGKQFTALAVLLLCHEKKISLDTDFRNYLPGMLSNIPQRISILHLLTHQSGIRDFYELLSLQGITWWKRTMNNFDILKMLQQLRDLNFLPGTQYMYSNSNYVLLAELVQVWSGKSFSDYTGEMFRRLGMNQTSFEADFTKIPGRIARPYFNFSSWSSYDWIWNGVGDGNIFSTLPDQLRWEQIVQTGKCTGFPSKLIRQTQQLFANANLNNYGAGVEYMVRQGQTILFHNGATGAWKAAFVRIPSIKWSVVVLTNSGRTVPWLQANLVADMVFARSADAQPTVEIDAEAPVLPLADLTGIYTNGQNFYFQILAKDEKMVLRRSGRNDVELKREGGNLFSQTTDPDFKQYFQKNTDGLLSVTASHPSHAPYTLWYVPALKADSIRQLPIGRFTNLETQVQIETIRENGLYQLILNNDSIPAIALTGNRLLTSSFLITVTTDSTGNPILLYDGERVKRLSFVGIRQNP